MQVKESIQSEQMKLMRIIDLRNDLKELRHQNGPNSSKYITLSIQLDSLEKEYIEERIKESK
jgi:hypothetical protein